MSDFDFDDLKHACNALRGGLAVSGSALADKIESLAAQLAAAQDRLREIEAQENEPQGWAELAHLMLNKGHEYWEAAVKERGPGAVQWLAGDDGALFVFTRGEYSQEIIRFLSSFPYSQGRPVAPAASQDLPEDVEAVATCLEDDAAILRETDGWEEIPDNMAKAAELIRRLASPVAPAAAPARLEVFDRRCNYSAFAGTVCNKCGRVHVSSPYNFPPEAPASQQPAAPSHAVRELATNIRRNCRHMRSVADESRMLDFIDHIDTLAQQIESDQPTAQVVSACDPNKCQCNTSGEVTDACRECPR